MMFKVGLSILSLLHAAQAAEVVGILDQHNIYRCMHDAPLLTESDELKADAQAYADVLAAACSGLVHDPNLDGQGENLASCANAPNPVETCASGFDATPRWYDEIQFYVPGATGSSNTAGEAIGHFTQVVWKNTEELGCASSACTFDSGGNTFHATYVVCRYSPPGNFIGQYLENVDETVSTSEEDCQDTISGSGDPHMAGFQHQKFDFTGEDGEWYALIHDKTMNMNMRITQPMPEVPQVTYITGIGLSVPGADDEWHTFEITINDHHNLESECPEGRDRPCLADGALNILVDGKEAGIGELVLGSGVFLTALNLPGECRPFGHDKYWLKKEEEAEVRASRRLRSAFSPGVWIMKDRLRTDPEACDNYVTEASAAGTLFEHQSEHASLQITAPSISLRMNIGRVHQLAMRDPTDSFDLPDHVAYQMNIAFESIDDVSLDAQGILGETIQLRYDAEGNPITSGPDCIRGEEPMYKVTEPLAKGFALEV